MYFAFNGQIPIVDDSAYVSETAQIIGKVKIGRGCYIGHGAIVRGDYGSIDIGPETAIEEGVIIHAPPDKSVIIENRATIGHGAIIHGERIGANAVIGMGAVLSIYATVGELTIVGEGSVVTMRQNIPSRVVALGNPAKVVREVRKNDIEFWARGKQLYIDLAQQYREMGMHPVEPIRQTESTAIE